MKCPSKTDSSPLSGTLLDTAKLCENGIPGVIRLEGILNIQAITGYCVNYCVCMEWHLGT